MSAKITHAKTTHRYDVEFNGKRYDVIHNEGAKIGEWAVFSTTHTQRRYCDEDKPVAKRVVAATKAALARA